MKRFALPLSLAVLVFAQACSDSVSPDGRATLTPTNPTLAGNVPPPPTKTVIAITVFSTPVSGFFTGVYFANGGNSISVAAAAELADATLGWNGTAWLRLDNTQTLGSLASANARFQVTHGDLTDPFAGTFSGRGTLKIEDVTIRIVGVTSFTAYPDCGFPGAPCAQISFDATIDDDPVPGRIHHGTAEAFDSEGFCGDVYPPGDVGGEPLHYCPEGGCG